MKTHTLPLITAALLAVRVFGVAAVPWSVALAPLAVMLALAVLYVIGASLAGVMVRRALTKMGAQAVKAAQAGDDLPGQYL